MDEGPYEEDWNEDDLWWYGYEGYPEEDDWWDYDYDYDTGSYYWDGDAGWREESHEE